MRSKTGDRPSPTDADGPTSRSPSTVPPSRSRGPSRWPLRSVESLEGDLKASIPFLGGKIEKLAAPAIEAGFDIETMLLNEWLFGDDQPHDG